MGRKKYRTVSLPEEFFDKIQDHVKKHPELGYTGVADFIRGVVRENLEEESPGA